MLFNLILKSLWNEGFLKKDLEIFLSFEVRS